MDFIYHHTDPNPKATLENVNDISHDKALRIYRCGGLNCDSISPH